MMNLVKKHFTQRGVIRHFDLYNKLGGVESDNVYEYEYNGSFV